MSPRSMTTTKPTDRVLTAALLILGLTCAGNSSPAAGGAPLADDAPLPGHAASTSIAPALERMKADVTFLAADAQDGRAPGTKGIELAAEYIARAFQAAGLKPAPGAEGYFQPFTISGRPSLGKKQSLTFVSPGGLELKTRLSADFSPLAIGVGAALEKVPVVFAGYGISARESKPKIDYDDYAQLDVKGKAVLILRREPRQLDANSPFDGDRDSVYATFQHKATNALQHGAAAVFLVNNLAGLRGKRPVLAFGAAGAEPYSNIPFVMLSRELADKLLTGGWRAFPGRARKTD